MTSKSTTVTIDRDLEDLIPGFMQRRREDVASLRASLSAGRWEDIRISGHSMKGTGGGYGFEEISAIGAALETAATTRDEAETSRLIERLEQYLDDVVVEFE